MTQMQKEMKENGKPFLRKLDSRLFAGFLVNGEWQEAFECKNEVDIDNFLRTFDLSFVAISYK